MTRRPPLLSLLVLVLALMVAVQAVAAIVADVLWFGEVGQLDLLWRRWIADIVAGLVGGLLVGGAALASGTWALRRTRNRPIVLATDGRHGRLERILRPPGALPRVVVAVAGTGGVLVGAVTSTVGTSLLAAWYR